MGIELGKAEEVSKDGQPLPPRFLTRAELGKPFTLLAQGIVLPRGGSEQPGEPDCGAWLFDDTAFKLLPHDKKLTDKHTIAIRLQPTAVGRTRVRFVGTILGYERTFDVILEVTAPK